MCCWYTGLHAVFGIPPPTPVLLGKLFPSPDTWGSSTITCPGQCISHNVNSVTSLVTRPNVPFYCCVLYLKGTDHSSKFVLICEIIQLAAVSYNRPYVPENRHSSFLSKFISSTQHSVYICGINEHKYVNNSDENNGDHKDQSVSTVLLLIIFSSPKYILYQHQDQKHTHKQVCLCYRIGF